MTSPVEVLCNEALSLINYPERIGSIWEGSRQSKAALDHYAATRDEVLYTEAWPFARKDWVLTLLKSAPVGGYGPTVWSPTFPPLYWQYEYVYPADAVRIRDIKRTTFFVPNYAPRAESFSLYLDNGVTTIVSNTPGAIALGTARILDPSQWTIDFREMLVSLLGKKLQAALLAPQKESPRANNADGPAQQSA